MSAEKIERKIAVIFATDVVGYSKHMETDESETVQNLRACEKILTELFDDFDARLFNTGGDSFLAEFQSAVSAVECAVSFQEAIQERNALEETTVKLQFRIGINSGDVIKEKENLLGDGVNIAARLEALAQANGITIAKVIYDYVKGKTKFEFNDLGLQKVKQNEFHAYDLLLDSSHKRKIKSDRTKSKFLITAALAILISFGGLLYLGLSSNDPLKRSSPKMDDSAIRDGPYEAGTIPLNLDMCPGIYHEAFFDNLKNRRGHSYFFFMVGDPYGRCELGLGPTKNEGFLDCERKRKNQNIKIKCALFAKVNETGSYEISQQYKTWVTAREAVNDAELNDN